MGLLGLRVLMAGALYQMVFGESDQFRRKSLLLSVLLILPRLLTGAVSNSFQQAREASSSTISGLTMSPRLLLMKEKFLFSRPTLIIKRKLSSSLRLSG